MKVNLVIWVTSECNLDCKWCGQEYTMKENAGYQMSIAEVNYIVESCLNRDIHFDIIEITGGEATLWKNIKKGVEAFREIADTITLVTNGNDPELILSLNLPWWVVSSSQATKKQLEVYKNSDRVGNIYYNDHQHKKLTEIPIPGSVPALCNITHTPGLQPQNLIAYIKGKVYYCCNTYQISKKLPLTDDLVCNFEDDFMAKFSNKKYDKAQCAFCHCNGKVWEVL